jgi:hypothetical protein
MLTECAGCREELAELRATMALLDTWEAPEPSPYFLSKLDARMREERATAPAEAGLERARTPDLWTFNACAAAGSHGADGDVAAGRRSVSGVTNWDQPLHRRRRLPWCTIADAG